MLIMAKVTNEVLASKIDDIKESLGDLKEDVKKNTKFRQQAAGFVSAIIFIAGGVGALITSAITFFKGN